MEKVIGTLEIDILPMFIPINDKSYDRPLNPIMCLIVDEKSGMVIASEMSTPETGIFGNFINTVINIFFKYGLPKRINICNAFTGTLLEELCDVLKIKLSYEDYLPGIEEAEESFMGNI